MEPKRRTVMMAVCRTAHAWERYQKTLALRLGVPDPYLRILRFVARHPGASQQMIAQFGQVTTAAVNQTVKEMLKDGYLRKETDESDRRYSKLYLTEQGEALSRELRQMLSETDGKITAAIGAEREEKMIELLDLIHDCIREADGHA